MTKLDLHPPSQGRTDAAMNDLRLGFLSMIAACTIWGLSPVYYAELSHVPPLEVLAHRTFWSLIFFAGVLLAQGRLTEIRRSFGGWRRTGIIALAALMISINWFLFIFSVQIGRTSEASLGYYIFPLVAVLFGRFLFKEKLTKAQWVAVGLAALAVVVLTAGLGTAPWIALALAISFGIYGVIKRDMPLGPVVSVSCEVLLFLPIALTIIGIGVFDGQGAFGSNWRDSLLLGLSGPLTGAPLVLFSQAARRLPLGLVGVLQYINPSLQFLVAITILGEIITLWHMIAFPMIWVALVIYSAAILRQDRAARRAATASSGDAASTNMS